MVRRPQRPTTAPDAWSGHRPTRAADLDRRRFLRLLGTGAIGVASGCQLAGNSSAEPVSPATAMNAGTVPTPATPPPPTPGPLGERVLVVIELEGGNDGLSTLVPYGQGAYYDARPGLAVPADQVVALDGQLGLNARLGGLADRGVAALAGVGVTNRQTLSHFEMLDRWWRGDVRGTGGPETGFLGRCCDAVRGGEVLTGVSFASTATPIMGSGRARTAGIDTLEGATALFDEGNALLAAGIASIHRDGSGASPLVGPAREAMRDMVIVAELLAGLAPASVGYPDTELGNALGAASRIIRSRVGVRVVHVPFGEFDTHDSQALELSPLLDELNGALSVFLDDLGAAGMGDDVLVATISEFGRRVPENRDGTDHGNASVALLAGPVRAGVHGELPSLTSLDRQDNLIPTVDFGDYYATLATWLGLAPQGIVNGTPVPGVF